MNKFILQSLEFSFNNLYGEFRRTNDIVILEILKELLSVITLKGISFYEEKEFYDPKSYNHQIAAIKLFYEEGKSSYPKDSYFLSLEEIIFELNSNRNKKPDIIQEEPNKTEEKSKKKKSHKKEIVKEEIIERKVLEVPVEKQKPEKSKKVIKGVQPTSYYKRSIRVDNLEEVHPERLAFVSKEVLDLYVKYGLKSFLKGIKVLNTKKKSEGVVKSFFIDKMNWLYFEVKDLSTNKTTEWSIRYCLVEDPNKPDYFVSIDKYYDSYLKKEI
jgi:hypothetical protein